MEELGLPRDPDRPPLLRVALPAPAASPADAVDLPALTLEPVGLPARPPSSTWCSTLVEQPGGLRLDWRYDADLFDPATIDALARPLRACFVGGWLADPAAPRLGAAAASPGPSAASS